MGLYLLVAAILWLGFLLSLLGVLTGVVAQLRGKRTLALILLFLSVIGTLGFSYIGGFSIGRFTALIPVLVIGYVLGMGRGATALIASLVGAALTYLALTWILYPVVPFDSALSFLFTFWAIPAYAVLALTAFGLAVVKPPRPRASAS